MKKILLNERYVLIALVIAALIFAVWLIFFSPLSKPSENENTQKTDEIPSLTKNLESEVSWMFGEETGIAGLVPLSCTKQNGIYTYTFYDAETGVMYYLVRDETNSATASGSGILVNPDGTPKIYTPYPKDSSG